MTRFVQRALRRAHAPAALLALAGCADTSATSGASRVEIVTPPPAQASPGDDLGVIVVRLVDDEGLPQSGVRVTWSGDGLVVPDGAASDPDGLARARWQLPRFLPDSLDESDAFPNSGPPGPFGLAVALPGQPATRFTVETAVFTSDRVEVGWGAACGLRGTTLWCWGPDIAPDIVAPAGGSHDVPYRPFAVTAAGRVIDMALAAHHLCVLDDAGGVRCAGRGTGGSFVVVPNAPPLRTLRDGATGFCGLAVADAAAWCWDWESGTISPASRVLNSPAFDSLVVGGELNLRTSFACGLTPDGVAWCWGSNGNGELGDGSFTSRPTPAPVAGTVRFANLALSDRSACGLARDGQTWCWGLTFGTTPVLAPIGGASWRQLVATWGEQFHVLGAEESTSWTYGGVFGLPALDSLHPMRQLAGDDQDVCTILSGGTVYCSANAVNGFDTSSLTPEIQVAVPVPE